MTLTLTVAPLGPRDAPQLRALLVREPSPNLYLLGILEEFGVASTPASGSFTFWGSFQEGELAAAVFVGGSGGLIVPSAHPSALHEPVAEALSKKGIKLHAAMGEREAVDVLVRYLVPGKPRLSRTQRLFTATADDLGPFTNPTLRLAREEDVERLLPLAAGYVKETFGTDPLEKDTEGFRARLLQRIRGKRSYVLDHEGELVFKVDVGTRSQWGAELEGLYTRPDFRSQGHATLSLGQISRHLLSSLPRLTLRVPEDAPSIATMARKVGYVGGRSSRLVVTE